MHQNQRDIKTDRLILRKLKNTDWEMISYLRSDKEINKFVSRPSAETKEKALGFISDRQRDLENNKIYYWVITEMGEDRMIGSICLWNFSKTRKTAEAGYDLAPSSQGNGFMNEALQGVAKFGFNELNLDCIEAYTHHDNSPSLSLLVKNGFKLIVDKKDLDHENNVIFELCKDT